MNAFPIRYIHQIEMTSRCNLRCQYCTSPHLGRPKIDMSEADYTTALKWAGVCVEKFGQYELNLTGIGESTMHPEFVRYVHLAREAVGPDCTLLFTTNGLLITEEMVRALRPSGVRAFVSAHRPEKAGPAAEILRRYNMLLGISFDPITGAVDWAGQVEWTGGFKAKPRECIWVKYGRAYILADGRVSRCCFDSTGEGVFGHLSDFERGEWLNTSPWHLCHGCDQDVGVSLDGVPRKKIIPLKQLSRLVEHEDDDYVGEDQTTADAVRG